jgi:hypothetical protein
MQGVEIDENTAAQNFLFNQGNDDDDYDRDNYAEPANFGNSQATNIPWPSQAPQEQINTEA